MEISLIPHFKNGKPNFKADGRYQGLVLARRIKKVAPLLLIMSCTFNNRQKTQERMKRAGFKTVVLKPVYIDELLAEIKKVLNVSGTSRNPKKPKLPGLKKVA
jgi:CheY-like chemotaxis protein